MKAMILAAGYGKRLNPITLSKPKPLIEINNTTLLQNTLNLVTSLGVKNILINSFYLSKQIEEYVANLSLNLKVISDGDKILDTGGGILNLINLSTAFKENGVLIKILFFLFMYCINLNSSSSFKEQSLMIL